MLVIICLHFKRLRWRFFLRTSGYNFFQNTLISIGPSWFEFFFFFFITFKTILYVRALRRRSPNAEIVLGQVRFTETALVSKVVEGPVPVYRVARALPADRHRRQSAFDQSVSGETDGRGYGVNVRCRHCEKQFLG